ncbi:MAG: MerR family transcriptional regulator [Deltaproteobacteria bacterium]|uniref:MerR family transcriptional regulator n=1 Tax=Candidatus Zymogenus saltonus TaxID=2844893 RepID=A0A9D8PQ32_9DELT|nr:MerR family transcriptional regulator [Candidatus Zymogenus saltonus]
MSKDKVKETNGDEVLKASDVQKCAGISYRQLNDWDSKGIISSSRKKKAGWRTFSTKEVFMLMICKEIRDKFGTPLESLGFIKSFMLQDKADHFRYALEMMALYGLNVYLLTDLKETFIMDNELEFRDLFKLGFFRGEESKSYIFISINPIVNRMSEARGIQTFKADGRLVIELDKMAAKGFELQQILQGGNYSKVIIQLKNGQIFQVDTEEELGEEEKENLNRELMKVFGSEKYGNLMLKMHDGEITRATRTLHKKVKKATERT